MISGYTYAGRNATGGEDWCQENEDFCSLVCSATAPRKTLESEFRCVEPCRIGIGSQNGANTMMKTVRAQPSGRRASLPTSGVVPGRGRMTHRVTGGTHRLRGHKLAGSGAEMRPGTVMERR